jgi:hypothetical protein
MPQEALASTGPSPRYPQKRDRQGPATVFRVPASGSGKEASPLLLVFRSLQQELGTRRKSLPLQYTEGKKIMRQREF